MYWSKKLQIVCHGDQLKVKDNKYVTVPRNDDFIACMVNGLNFSISILNQSY